MLCIVIKNVSILVVIEISVHKKTVDFVIGHTIEKRHINFRQTNSEFLESIQHWNLLFNGDRLSTQQHIENLHNRQD